MSYHAHNNTHQKSLSFFLIIAFHILLIWALANGLGTTIVKTFSPQPITTHTIEKKVEPVILPTPQTPNTDRTQTIDVLTPPPVDFIAEPTVITSLPLATQTLTSGTGKIPVTKPKIRTATTPEYPSAAIRLNEEGTTGLRLYITANGRVAEANVLSTSGSARLDDAAIKHALRNWVFTPCTEDGKAVGCWFQTNLVWRLEDAKR